jgi:hypothetical protein
MGDDQTVVAVARLLPCCLFPRIRKSGASRTTLPLRNERERVAGALAGSTAHRRLRSDTGASLVRRATTAISG